MSDIGAGRPLNVCQIMSADLWAGAEVQVATLCTYLAGRDDVRLSAVLLNEGQLARELRALGVDVAVFDERHHSAFRTVQRIAEFLAERKVHLVHMHRYKDTIVGTAAAKLAGVPHVVRTVHGLTETMVGWDRAKLRAFETIEKAVLWSFADRVIAVSEGMAEMLTRAGHRSSSVVAVHNGVDLSRIRALRSRDGVREDLGIPADAVLIGTAGRLSPVKAQCSLLRAARRILDERPEARFVVAGDGPRREELQALAETLGVARQSVFAGVRMDIYDVIASMDIFVLPSLSEGIPMALLEAMALGRPVVASAVGGIPEMIQHGTNGLLVPPADPKALADACLELTGDPDRAAAMGAAARRTVEASFSHEANGAAVLAMYRNVSRGRGHALTERPGMWALCRRLIGGFIVRACRKVLDLGDAAAERARMARVRRDPAVLAGALRSVRQILIVCQGNIIRSPFAASLIAQRLLERGRIAVVSAGLAAVRGNPAHPTALQIAGARSVDLSAHAATPITADSVAASDVIFVMDVAQLVLMKQRFPEARDKTFLLTCLACDTPLEIRDPYAGDESMFQSCFEHISRAVQPLVRALSGAASYV